MAEVTTCKLKYRPNRQNQIYLASFSNGRLKHCDRDNIEFTGYKCGETADGIPRKRVQRILVANTGKMQYLGCNFGNNLYERGQFFKQHIGVLNKKTGKMKLYDVDLYNMKPILVTEEEKTPEGEEKGFVEKLKSLTDAFGSKIRKRHMNLYSKRKLDSDDLSLSTMNAIEESVHDEFPHQDIQAQSAEAIPFQNTNAENAEDVYNIADIILDEEFEETEAVADVLKNASVADIERWEENSTYANYVIQHLKMNQGYQEIRRKDPAPEIPDTIKRKFLENFTVIGASGSGKSCRTLPPKMKDKIMAYALVVALFIDDFCVDLSEVQSDFKVATTKLIKIAYALGCHVLTRKINNEATKFAELSIPLFIPRSKPFNKRRR